MSTTFLGSWNICFWSTKSCLSRCGKISYELPYFFGHPQLVRQMTCCCWWKKLCNSWHIIYIYTCIVYMKPYHTWEILQCRIFFHQQSGLFSLAHHRFAILLGSAFCIPGGYLGGSSWAVGGDYGCKWWHTFEYILWKLVMGSDRGMHFRVPSF